MPAAENAPASDGRGSTVELEKAAALNNLAMVEQRRDHLEAAGVLLQQAYAILERNNAMNSALAGLLLSNMGLQAERGARYREAQEAYRRAFPLIRAANGEESESFAKLLKNSALLSFELGQFEDALDKNMLAEQIESRLSSVKTLERALTLNNLGLTLAALQRFPAAEKAYAAAIELRQHEPGIELDQAKTLNNLAMLEKEEDHLVSARGHAKEALQLAGTVEPKQSTTVASILNTIGQIASAENNLAEAKKSFEKANEIWIQVLGAEHPSYAATLSNLAVVESRQGHHKKAQQMFETSLAIDEAKLGPVNRRVAGDLTNIGVELFWSKNYQAALDRFNRAEQIQGRCFREPNQTVANLWRSIALTYAKSKDLDASAAAYRKAIESLKAAAGPESAGLCLWLREYAQVLRERRHFGEAEQAEVEALRIQVRNTLRNSRKSESGAS